MRGETEPIPTSTPGLRAIMTTSAVPRCTPWGTNPFRRIQTPVGDLDAFREVPNAVAPGQRR